MSNVAPMSTPQPPLTESSLSLDERIRRTELRLIAREDSLKRRIDLLGQRVQQVLEPRRYIAPAVGVAMASWALWLMLSRRRPRARAPGARARAPAAGMLSELPWVHLLPLVLPLLPAGWRARINPATVATVVSLGLPLVARLLARRARR
jgi:apolipoprotein D and lipocalin family protein